MRSHRLDSESGLTIIEVLISATVFIVGFSIMVANLANLMTRFSVDELTTASQIAEDILVVTESSVDETDLDSIVVRGGISYAAERRIVVADGLIEARVLITRKNKPYVLADLYYEIALPQR